MRARAIASILMFILAVTIMAGGCATGKKAQMEEEELFKKLSGTWVNEDYDKTPGSDPIAKYVIERDGTFDAYADTYDTSRTFFGEIITVEDKWIDSDGNIWYKMRVKDLVEHLQRYELGKIHNSGTVWELISLSYEYPNELDPNHSNYRIYYRKE